MSESKRFEDWVEVDCNECEHYWDSSCSGVKTPLKSDRKPCTSFLATRSVVIPLQIKALRSHLKWLYGMIILEGIAVVVLGVIALG